MGTPRLPPFAIVLRFSGLTIDQETLEKRLDFDVERFEPERNSPGSYAQINLDCEADDPWSDTLELLGQIGRRLLELKAEGVLRGVEMDIAYSFPTTVGAIFRSIPHGVAKIAGYTVSTSKSRFICRATRCDCCAGRKVVTSSTFSLRVVHDHQPADRR
jgi:hypothetical protein